MSSVETSGDPGSKANVKKERFLDVISRPAFISLMLALLTVFVYRAVIGFDFIYYDDTIYVSENPHVQQGLTWSNFLWAFQATENSSWYPLMWLSFMLDVSIFGKGAAGPHFINLLFHAANTALLFLTLRQLTAATWRSAMVAALFALHPLHVESVAWVSERKDVLSTFFGLVSLWLFAIYARQKAVEVSFRSSVSNRFYRWSLFFFVLALLSKPMQVTLPCIMLLLDFWPLNRMRNISFWDLFREKIPFFALSVVFTWVTVQVHHNAGALTSLADNSLLTRVLNALAYYALYLGKACWPALLILPYRVGIQPTGLIVISIFVVGGLCVGACAARKRYPYLFMGWFWFLGALVPVIGIVAWGTQSIADRFTYVPLIGIFIAVVWGAGAFLSARKFPVGMSAVLAGGVLLACGWRTADQLRYWQNSETLFRHTLAYNEGSDVAHFALACHLTKTGRKSEANLHYRRTVELDPDSITVLYSVGTAFYKAKEFVDASHCFERLVGISRTNVDALCSLGETWIELGKSDDAIQTFNQALQNDPKSVRARCGLGNAMAELGKNEEAFGYYAEALKLDPDSGPTHYNLANVLLKTGKTNEAVQHYVMALANQPEFAEAESNFGTVLLQLGRTDEAIQHFRAVIAYEPGHLGAHVNLGNALAGQKKLEEAAAEFATAVGLDPDSLAAQLGLGVVLAQLGQRDQAILHLNEALRLKPDLTSVKELIQKLSTPPQ